MNKILLNILLLLCTYSGVLGQPVTNRSTSGLAASILFVGNSLTYTNNLPELVVEAAELKGIVLKTEMLALPNYAIIDHWSDGEVQNLISNKKYDFVIIQQGPSSQKAGRRMLIEDGQKYDSLCALHDVKLCYFMVWPALPNFQTFDAVIKNYTDAARINNALIIPVGEVWKAYFERTHDVQYYASDGFHPSLKGSQIAAEVIVDHLFRE